MDEIYEIRGALYGTKDAPHDYQVAVQERMTCIGCQRLHKCRFVHVKRTEEGHTTIVYGHVDDFVYTGDKNELIMELIGEYRKLAQTTEPIMIDKEVVKVLGMELKRERDSRIILLTMTDKIREAAEKYLSNEKIKVWSVPMPTNGYVIRESEIELLNERQKRSLSRHEITDYLGIVGILLWIPNVRMDIIFTVLYLSWHTKAPLQHHYDMGLYCIGYLYNTMDMPLVLGGNSDIQTITMGDASHATGPRNRSISGRLTCLGKNSGAVLAKSHAQL
jgi:hypothetical protein